MNRRIALVSCVKSKLRHEAPAKELYTSPLFRGFRRYAEANADLWFILSAEHGLLHPEQVIGPYERTLNKMSAADRARWATSVCLRLSDLVSPGTEVVVLAGKRYREGIVPFLLAQGCTVSTPLEGLSLGQQLRWLAKTNESSSPAMAVTRHVASPRPEFRRSTADGGLTQRQDGSIESHLQRFYELLTMLSSRIDQGRALAEYSGKRRWPGRGVYFFREPGEYRTNGSAELRITRVGTHAVSAGSKSSLWGRLRAHRGGRDGRGNHRGSIFRLHVGMALLQRDPDLQAVPSWSVGQSAPKLLRELEVEHERRVSEYIGRMSVLWVNVPDEPSSRSARALIERNSIALLANQLAPLDCPSEAWLGRHSPRDEIQRSGLWNLNHVQAEYDPAFLDMLSDAVIRTE